MSGFSKDEAIARYLSLIEEHPELADNPPGRSIELLTDPALFAMASEAAGRAREADGRDTGDLRVGVLASDPYMTVIRDAVRFANGTYGLYNRIFEPPAVAVLPLLDGKPVLIRVFRHGLREWSLEFPRGGVEPGETHEGAAERELAEEIGAKALELVDLGAFTPGGSTLAIRSRLFFARIDGLGALDHAEGIGEVLVTEPGELEQLIESGRIIDGFSMSLFARARLKGLV